MEKRAANPLSCSFAGNFYGPIGCFPIGLNASQEDFDHVLRSQQRLRSLELLSRVSAEQLHSASTTVRDYANSSSAIPDIVPTSREAMLNFANALARTNDEKDDPYQVRIYSGLDSGFHTPSGGQFWAVWEIDPRTGCLIIYVSKSSQDLTPLLLHTYLSRSS